MSRFTIQPAAARMPDCLTALAVEATEAGIRNVPALAAQWADGTQRFDDPGELLLVAISDASDAGAAIGVGGLTVCPDVPDAFRVRRFYVAEAWRRRGVAQAIAQQLLTHGLEHTDTISCNAQASAAAPLFWEALGFVPVEQPGITHILRSA